MPTLVECLNTKKNDVLTLIGSGGKTSLLWLLGVSFPTWRILLTTTTKMSDEPWRLFRRFIDDVDLCQQFYPEEPGSYLLAQRLPDSEKLQSLPVDVLRPLLPRYDLVVIEGDGSQRRPLKGWADHEPVVLADTTITVGILPLSIVGRQADDTTIHRFSLFSDIANIQKGERIQPIHLVRAIAHPNGLWRNAQSKRILLLNRVETDETRQYANEIQSLLHQFNALPECVIAGIIQNNFGICL